MRCGRVPTVRSSVKSSNAAKNNLVDLTREVWQPRAGRELSAEDARQITENITGFFAILAEWSQADMPAPADGGGTITTSGADEVHHGR